MALVSLNDAKVYLRVDSSDENTLIESLIQSAESLCADIGRMNDDEWAEVNADATDSDSRTLKKTRTLMRIAMLYTIGYLFEHREEADHHDLSMTLRNLLSSVREGKW